MNGELSGGKNGIVYERQETVITEQRVYLKPSVQMEFTASDVVFAYAMIACGFLYWNLITISRLGFGVSLFTAVLCTMTVVYFRCNNMKQTKSSLLVLGMIAASAVNFSLFDSLLIKGLNFMFLTACFVYWICMVTERRLENKVSLYILGDFIHQMLLIPFANFNCCFSGIQQALVRTRKGKGVLAGSIGILFSLPILILVVSLLTDADAAFENVMTQIRFSFSENIIDYFWQFLLGLPVACYLFGMIYGNRYKRNTEHITLDSVNKMVTNARFVPGVTVYTALTALNLIYLVFFLAQTTYLLSAFQDALPQSMTYAEYARRGFFELCAVSGINFAVIAFAHILVKRDHVKMLRGETAAVCIFTIALIATAMSKMGMYIHYYGLTQLRVYTSWFMAVLLLVFVIMLIRQFKNFNGTRISIAISLCMFLLLTYGNADGLIAKYNIDRYQAGTLETVDVEALSQLSDAAVPYLYGLFQQTDDIRMKAELRRAINKWYERSDHYNESFRDFNLQTYRADLIRDMI